MNKIVNRGKREIAKVKTNLSISWITNLTACYQIYNGRGGGGEFIKKDIIDLMKYCSNIGHM